MAWSIDPSNGDIVINGFQNGIGDAPTLGLTDVRNVNTISIPGEADVNFSTAKISSGAISGTVTSVSGNVLTATISGTMENYICIYFTTVGSYSGPALYTPYWVGNLSGSTFKIYSDYKKANLVSVTGTGSAAFTAYQIGIVPSYVTGGNGGGIQYFAQPTNIPSSSYFTFGVDGTGLVWSNFEVTGTNSYWTYTGNYVTDGTGGTGDQGVSNGSGNGLVYWRVSNGLTGSSVHMADYVFVFRNSQLDFFAVTTYGGGPTTGTWNYGWNPSTGVIGGVNSPCLATPPGTNNSHHAIIAPDGRMYFCDADDIQKIYQTSPTTIFNPSSGDTSTHTYLTFPLLPINDVAQCIAPQGTNILIGGQGYYAYNWNTTATIISNYIPLAEPFVARIVTINVNSYIFAGNRGRVYITNGSQAQLWKKIPDHVSGTIEPRYQWGGATAVKNQLYFSFKVSNNSGTAITTEGGLWAADLDSKGIRLTNKLSYGTYTGYATALIAQIYNPTVSVSATGTALFIGWDDNTGSNFGIDIPSTNLYTAGESYVVSDLIPIGTALQPQTPLQLEFKLSMPLLASESVELQIGSSLADYINSTFTSLGTTNGSGSSTILSDNKPLTGIQNLQWVIVKCILTGKNSNPSFNRLTELRIKGVGIKQTAMFTTQ